MCVSNTQVEGPDDWMTKYFFSGGTMPSLDLMLYFQDDLSVKEVNYVNGTHYSKTLEEWLRRMDRNQPHVMKTFEVFPWNICICVHTYTQWSHLLLLRAIHFVTRPSV